MLIENANEPEFKENKRSDCLSLNSSQLTELPVGLADRLSNLVRLDLSGNLLTELPDSIGTAKSLECLNLSENRFESVPRALTDLHRLRSLTLSGNKLSSINEDLSKLCNIEELDLSRNPLENLPDSMASRLNRLKRLNLAGCRFSRVPGCVASGLNRLEVLDLSENRGVDLGRSPCSTVLVEFRARSNGNCPCSFPNWILSSTYPRLRIVTLDETRFRSYELPPRTVFRSRIRRLSMRQCGLSDNLVRRIIEGMTSLERLDIGNQELRQDANILWQISLDDLDRHNSTLKEIVLSNVGLATLPRAIENFANLSVIDVTGNKITWLPEEICKLANLQCLLAGNNGMAFLSENIGRLESLERLNLSNNKLCDLPESVGSLKRLQFLDLYNNELSTVPDSLKELPMLRGLDLEQNYVSTDSLPIDLSGRYDGMLTVSRVHWRNEEERLNGRKFEPSSSSDNQESPVQSWSSEDDISESYGLLNIEQPTEGNGNEGSERWDLSEDSSDEFDPHEGNKSSNRFCAPSPLAFYDPTPNFFCPAELHPPLISRLVAQLRRNQGGSRSGSRSEYQEGQFEDA